MGDTITVNDQIGLSNTECRECAAAGGYKPDCENCQEDYSPLEALGDLGNIANSLVQSYMDALANFPSYQFDGRHAFTPEPQGF